MFVNQDSGNSGRFYVGDNFQNQGNPEILALQDLCREARRRGAGCSLVGAECATPLSVPQSQTKAKNTKNMQCS